MAKKTNNSATGKNSSGSSSIDQPINKGNSSNNRRTTNSKANQSNSDDTYSYASNNPKGSRVSSNDYGDNLSSAGGNTSNAKASGASFGGYSSGSSTKRGAYYNDNYDSGASNDSGNRKNAGGYSEGYEDRGSSINKNSYNNDYGTSKNSGNYSDDRYESGPSTKENNTYEDSYDSGNRKNAGDYSDGYEDSASSINKNSYNSDYSSTSSYSTSKNSGNYSDDGYESGASTKGNNTYSDPYTHEDSYDYANEKNTGGYSKNEPINDPPPFNDYNDEVVAKHPTKDSRNQNKGGGNDNQEADMVFTEDEVYGDKSEDSDADMVFTEYEVYGNQTDTNRGPSEEERPSSPLARITPSQILRIKQRLHIPEHGFVVSAGEGRTVRKNVEVTRINQLLERLENPQITRHVQDTINLFVNETDSASHQDRNQIDIALILAIAIRESGVDLVVSRSSHRIVSAGADAHSQGRSGLDWIYAKKRAFPSALRNEVQPVRDNPSVGGAFRRPNVTPAYLRERDLLAAFIVEVNVRYDRFLRFFHEREFHTEFTADQRAALLRNLSGDARRAWIQAAFGSKLSQLLQAVKNLIHTAIESGTSFNEIVANHSINLNAIITNDSMMTENLSRQRTRISAAEALLIEEALGNRF